MASLLGRLGTLRDRFRNPDHTGARRCWPCTALNLTILLLACAGVARRRSRSLAAVLGASGAGAVALRGYLVPFTPRFAPGLAARLPGDAFHAPGRTTPTESSAVKDPSAAPDASGSLGGDRDASAGGADHGEAVLAALVDAGVVAADERTVYLDDEFRAAWRAEMRELRGRNAEGLANALRAVAPEGTVVDAVEPDDGRWNDHAREWFVVSDGCDDPARERWLTKPVAVAETAAVWVLADRTDLSEAERVRATGPLRTFLEACPVCDGPVEETTTVECCGGPGGARADAPDDVLACADCGARLYTFR